MLKTLKPDDLKQIRVSELCLEGVWIPQPGYLLEDWLQLLDVFATSATGLRKLRVRLDTGEPWGFGDNLKLMRALAKIQGLEEFKIVDVYAKDWPQYLKTALKCRVLATYGSKGPEVEVQEGDTAVELVSRVKFSPDYDEGYLNEFLKYQSGVKDRNP
jgi:hypothetical protein